LNPDAVFRIDPQSTLMTLSRNLAGLALTAATLLFGGVLLSACEPKTQPVAATAAPPSISGRVRVLDADVLIIDGRHVALANAYPPESLLHSRCWAESIAADHATEFVKELVEHARSVNFTPNGATDKYNRALGLVSIDGADLGDTLFEQGLAARVVDPRFDWCQPISKQADGAPKISALYTPN
jgi:endonuclease YncB( thermonuclease family)